MDLSNIDLEDIFTNPVIKKENIKIPVTSSLDRAIFYCDKALENKEIGEGDLRFIRKVLINFTNSF